MLINIGVIGMCRSTHLIIFVLLVLCMCIECVAPSDRTDEAIVSTNVSGDAIKAGACMNLDRVDEINNRKNGTAQNASEAEEYEVYDYLIGPGDANRTLVVIYENTTYRSKGSNRSDLLKDMELRTIEDFKAKNSKVYPLQNLFKFKGKYVIVNESEIYEVFSVNQEKETGDEWEEFYGRCPNSPGILYFSRVGFNSNLDQALVEEGYDFPGMLAGRGYLLLLEKSNGKWNVTSSTMTWIS